MADIHPVTLPKWGLEMSEGLISRWIVAEGALVEPGTEIVDIETDKIVNTLDTEKGGTLRRILVPEGETVPVGALIAVLAGEGVPDAEVAAFVAGYVPVDASFEPKAEAPAAAPAAVETATAPAAEVKASPLARRIAGQDGIDLAGVQGSGVGGKVKKADLPAAAPAALSPDEAARRNAALHASPVATGFANALGLDLTGIRPSGYKGRISLDDARAAATAAGLWRPEAAPAAVTAVAPVTSAAAGVEEPYAGMRKSIARALTLSKQTVPHFYSAMDVEVDALMALRAQLNEGREGARISVNDFLLRAAALALKAHPEVNVHVSDTGITRFDQVDLCVAVAIDAGLITPVIRNAAARPLSEISAEAARLIAAARDRSLTAEELRGGTFTLSNLGMYGLRAFDAIINPPQGAILAIGGPRREARECPQNGIRFATTITLTLSADHRAIDGATAAIFLNTIKNNVEKPMKMMC